jgi:predicted transcriptional regulator
MGTKAKKNNRSDKRAAKQPSRRAPYLATKKHRVKGEKRTPNELRHVVEKLFAYIKKNPGEGIESIGRGLGLPTSELVLPVKKLRAAKRIKTKGFKRARKYSARAR